MAHNLAEAARATGKNRTTILRAIKNGTISGYRDEKTGEWLVEPAELHRIYEAVSAPAQAHRRNAHLRIGGRATDRELQIRIDAQERIIAAHEATIDDLRRRLDRTEERVTQLLLAPPARREVMPDTDRSEHSTALPEHKTQPPSPPKGAWRRFLAWRRGR